MIDLQQSKIKVDLSGIPQTSLLILYGRAEVSKEHGSLFNDEKALELVERLDYDFSTEKAITDYLLFASAARAMQFDNKVKEYITKHPLASVVNLGAGFETEFYRTDNGKIRWYDLDLPELIEIRKQLLPETDRSTCIAKSFLDPGWCKDVNTQNGVLIIACGLLRYFDEAKVRQLFLLLADHFPGCEVVFDIESKSSSDADGGGYGAGWSNDEPEKRGAMLAERFKSFKNAWKAIPQSLKDKVLGTLTTATKPIGTEWVDIEIWWNKLNAQEKSKAMHEFGTSLGITCKWALDDANEMTKWDDRIKVVEQFSIFKNIPRDPSLSTSIRQFMNYTDEKGRMKIIHLRA